MYKIDKCCFSANCMQYSNPEYTSCSLGAAHSLFLLRCTVFDITVNLGADRALLGWNSVNNRSCVI